MRPLSMILLATVLTLGCNGGDTQTDSDAEFDTDSDTDTDSNTDTETDTVERIDL